MLKSLSDFQRMVDSAHDEVTSLSEDLPRLYDHYRIPKSASLSRDAVCEELQGRVRKCFADPRKAWKNCATIRTELICGHVLAGAPLQPYFAVLERIQDAVRGEKDGGGQETSWPTAVQLAADLSNISPWERSEAAISQLHARDFNLAHAIGVLLEQGFAIGIRQGEVDLKESEAHRIAECLLSLIRDVGGLDVVKIIFLGLEEQFDDRQERYHLARRVDPLGPPPPPLVPFGYLLHLAAKCLSVTPSKQARASWEKLIRLSAAFASTFDVQPYNAYQLMFNDYSTIIHFLREVALYDALFTFPQIRPADAIKIARGVLDELPWDEVRQGGRTLTEMVETAEAFLSFARGRRGPVTFAPQDLICPSMSPERVKGTLCDVFAHSAEAPNEDFIHPADLPGPTLYQKPLIMDQSGNFTLLDVSLAGIPVIESLLTELRRDNYALDDGLGASIETFLKDQFLAHGIRVAGGTYLVEGERGECDLVVETLDAVLLFEIKKKPLTRRARAGGDTSILIDLATSLLEAQLQAGGHEIRLRRTGALTLTSQDSQTHELVLGERQVERIAITFLDFGGFQDRMVLKQFLEAGLVAEYSTLDPALQKRFERLSKDLGLLREQYHELAQLDPQRQAIPFFHCWFLSVPQMLILLDDVSGAESLKSALWSTRHMTTGSLDFYFELYQARKLHEATIQKGRTWKRRPEGNAR